MKTHRRKLFLFNKWDKIASFYVFILYKITAHNLFSVLSVDILLDEEFESWGEEFSKANRIICDIYRAGPTAIAFSWFVFKSNVKVGVLWHVELFHIAVLVVFSGERHLAEKRSSWLCFSWLKVGLSVGLASIITKGDDNKGCGCSISLKVHSSA